MLTVACVYRTGGDFNERDVRDFMRGVLDNLKTPYRTVCLTDRGTPYLHNTVNGVIRLEHDWPGWWSKMELFKLPGPVLYFDLDTRIIGDIGPLAAAVEAMPPDRLLMLRGFYKDDPCSGILGWTGDASWILRGFEAVAKPCPARFAMKNDALYLYSDVGSFRGDQDYLAWRLREEPDRRFTYAQDLVGGIYSYKVHVRGKGLLADARVICFHGKPRPRDVVAEESWL